MRKISGYKLYIKKPNTISKGSLYIKEIEVNVNNIDKKRLVRVYLPSNYDFDNPNKRFPVMYMMDGKNLFDDYTSFVGEWKVDEAVEKYVLNNNSGLIIVGIDSAKQDMDRTNEMLPESNYYNNELEEEPLNGYGSILASYIMNNLKEEIDQIFYTIPDKEHTSVGGSSMGGLYAFYMGMKYKEKISFSICFSPAFALYKEQFFKNALQQIKSNKEYGKFFFYIGNDELEQILKPLTEYTYQYLTKVGFNKDQVRYIFDSSMNHNEEAWQIYFELALKYWNVLDK